MKTNPPDRPTHHEHRARTLPGWPMLGLFLLVLGLLIWFIVRTAMNEEFSEGEKAARIILTVLTGSIFSIFCRGFFTLQPNEGMVLILFGAYQGTTRKDGFHYTNPFNRKQRISLRARNLNGERLKVNDKRGNPVEI